MSALFGWSSTAFDKLLEKATSHLLLEPDWDAILQICDCIRQNDVQPKYAVASIKKKLYAQNPHVVLYALQVLESCVKNCGSPVHTEVASRQFMEELRELVKNTTNENVKNRILDLIQTWAHAFRNEPKYRAIQDIFNLLRMEGYKLQVLKESDAMFSADTAPDWADGDCCNRCRVQFSLTQRKHHCRNCGQIFCNKCSSRNSPIPRFGIEKEVRVCEACWEKLNKPGATKSGNSSHESSPQQNSHDSGSIASGKSEQELKEEEDLQLALALSQSEAESKEKAKSSVHTSYSSPSVEPNPPAEQNKKSILTSFDNELDRYLNRGYWEQRQQQQQKDEHAENRTSPVPSAPASNTAPVAYNSNKVNEKYQNGETDEISDFLSNLRGTLEIFVNRMKSNSSRGRPIANDSYVQSLFMNITNMHSQLLKFIQEQEDLRAYYEGLQDKLSQARDSRAALDALREDNRERLRREAEEAERLRQIQMAQKLEIMRKQKQEYLQFQRQLAMQRMQEQEREMQLRHEQQKQQYVMHQGGTLPSGVFPPQATYMPPASQGYPTMHPSVPAMMHPGMPGNPPFQAPPPQIPTSVNNSASQQMPGNDYRQPFNMQAMSATLPSVHPGSSFPHVPASSGAPTSSSAQPPMMMPPGVMGPMPPPPQMTMMPHGIPQSMMQQNPPPTSVPQPVMTQNPPVTNMGGIPQPLMPPASAVPPGQQIALPTTNVTPIAPPPVVQEPPQQAPPVQEESSDPLIVFD